MTHDDSIWDEFWHAGSCSGHIVRDCKHGITFFHDDERAGSWSDGELEGLRDKTEKEPSKYRALDGDTHFTEQLGMEWCWDCDKCQKEALKYQKFIWEHQHSIASFLNARLKYEAQKAEEDRLKNSIKI